MNFSISFALSSVEVETNRFVSKLFVNILLIWFFFQVEEYLTGISFLLNDFLSFWLDTTPDDRVLPVNKSCDQVEAEAVLHEKFIWEKHEDEAEHHILI